MIGHITRRRAIAILSALAAWPALLTGRRAHAEPDDTGLFALIDRMLPEHGDDPGIRRLGLEAVVLSDLRDGPYAKAYRQALAALSRRLDKDRFLDMDDPGSDHYIAALLHEGGYASDTARRLLARAARRYYTHPGSWPAIGYTRPQPRGYPDYAACKAPDEPA